jgi:dolichol-phosphate mannosyltransferase
MYRNHRILAFAPVLDEFEKIGSVVSRMPRDVVDEILIVDDGSTDGSADLAESLGATVIRLGRTLGVGAAIRTGYLHARQHGFDVAVVVAGNNKDAPEEIPALIDPIVDGVADLVQGSRYLGSARDMGPMPTYRKLATRMHPMLFRLVSGRSLTDTTNGFRALRVEILEDERLDLDQAWLDDYELEVYLLYKAVKLGYRVVEIPVTKTYPPKHLGQTKMKPVTGWWSILRPLVLFGLGLKR